RIHDAQDRLQPLAVCGDALRVGLWARKVAVPVLSALGDRFLESALGKTVDAVNHDDVEWLVEDERRGAGKRFRGGCDLRRRSYGEQASERDYQEASMDQVSARDFVPAAGCPLTPSPSPAGGEGRGGKRRDRAEKRARALTLNRSPLSPCGRG